MQWLESETLRLSHLRDRASDLGRRKEYPFLHVDISMSFYLTSYLPIMSMSLPVGKVNIIIYFSQTLTSM